MEDYIKASDLALLTEGYELTMADGFMGAGMKDTVAYFDLFFRRVPDNGGFAIAAGLSKVIDYLEHLHFREEDIKYLKSRASPTSLQAISKISNSPVTYGQYPRALRFFRTSLS